MSWLKLIGGESFKDWLIANGSGSILRPGNFKLGPFGSSLRKLNNAHTWLNELNQTGSFNPSGRKTQAISDLSSVGLLDPASETLTNLGQAVVDEWTRIGIPTSDNRYEIHRCLVLVNEAFKISDPTYNEFFLKWLELREIFAFDFLMANKEYLYLFSYLDYEHDGYNPYEEIKKLDLTQENFDPTIDWDSLKAFYKDTNANTAIDKYSKTISGYASREGRSNLCVAYEILSRGGIFKDKVLTFLGYTGQEQDQLDAILETIEFMPSIKQIIFYGAPGTGKSYRVSNLVKNKEKRTERTTFHPEYDYTSFVGGYRPKMHGTDIRYEFVPQVFTKIYVEAWNDLSRDYYLVIEEINRGNCAEIFGDIFQLLDRKDDYTVSPSDELKEYLSDKFNENPFIDDSKLLLPPNLNILATMNTSDQSLFPMDSAFKRRWDWEYIPIDYTDSADNRSSEFVVKINDTESFKWIEFISAVNQIIKTNDNLGMDKCIGNYFINPTGSEINPQEFINKAIFYLWNDVFKDELEEQSIFKNDTTYEDFFPIETVGLTKIKEILNLLSVSINQ